MIRFACSDCGRHISVDDKYSGKKGKCPKCGSMVVVPDRSTIIEFHCEGCGHKIKVPEKYAGKKGRCPKCKNAVSVPSLRRESAEQPGTLSFACPMCSEVITVSDDSRGELVECPECGSHVEISPEGVPAVSADPDGTMPPVAEEDLYQGESEGPEGSASVDRRLVLIISGVALVVVVGLIVLVAVLRPSGSKPITADSQLVQFQPEQVQRFAEQYIGLLESGDLDEAHQFLSPGLADDIDKAQIERLAEQIGQSRIIKMDCNRTHREPRPEGDRTFLWYDVHCENGRQAVITSIVQIEQELVIDGIAARDQSGQEASLGPNTFGALSQMVATVTFERPRVPPGQFFSAIVVGFASGTFLSACCLWVGMKVTRVEGTFVAMLGIAAISSLAGMIPTLVVPVVPMACFGMLIGPIVMFVLICKWTDANFFPDAVGLVLVAGLVGILGRMFLGNFMAMV